MCIMCFTTSPILRPRCERCCAATVQQQSNLLAHHVPGVFGDETRRPVASQTLVHLTLVALEPGRTDALHVATAGQRARLGVHAVMVADVC
jgi:hypothetical protein